MDGSKRLVGRCAAAACALLLLGSAAGAAAPPARASSSQLSVMEDDRLLLYSGDATRERALDQMQQLGVTTIHALVIWRRLAPQPTSYTRPAFDATDPASYAGWGPYDALVEDALARGMQVLLTPTAPVPQWASLCARNAPRRWVCKPRLSDYAAFVRAIGTRYSGSYTAGGVRLPRVRAWSIWNEPNHRLWLLPHTARSYRALASAGLAALAATGHGRDLLLIGETAPGGGSKSTAPVDFMREVFCLDRDYRPYGGRAARLRGCERRPSFAIAGVSDHPYTSGAIGAPSSFKGGRADAPIASVGRLVTLLDRAARYGVVRRHASVYLTEFGFQTRPPDPYGLSLARQAEYLNESDYLAFMNPRVASVAQYELRDDPRAAVFNTGLCFASGRPKPALAAYALPIWVAHLGGVHVRIFGLVRAARSRPVNVAIQHRARGARTFHTVERATTNRAGYLLARLRDLGGRWRLATASGGAVRYSRVAA
jgi:hypothetical protein